MIGNKYLPFTQWLQSCGKETVSLTFEELEQHITIPKAAYVYRSYWANPQNPQSFQASWINAGYRVSQVSMQDRTVTFQQITSVAPIPNSNLAEDRISEELIQCGHLCLKAMRKAPNHRYLSWEHCHNAFLSQKGHSLTEEETDYLSLHLAWYLASWGMLRNSFLMDYDYQIHHPVVNEIMDSEWDDLWDLSAELMCHKTYAEKIQRLYDRISEIYILATGQTPTDTLITKIMLGTIGCTPAYDRYLKEGVSMTKKASRTFGPKSIIQLGQEYLAHFEEYEELRMNCSQNVVYPPAKVLDMCFFEYGNRKQKDQDSL